MWQKNKKIESHLVNKFSTNKIIRERLSMKISITEEMKFRKKVVEYAIKHNNNAKTARRYKTSRQQVQRCRKKYDGTLQSLANKSRCPHSIQTSIRKRK